MHCHLPVELAPEAPLATFLLGLHAEVLQFTTLRGPMSNCPRPFWIACYVFKGSTPVSGLPIEAGQRLFNGMW